MVSPRKVIVRLSEEQRKTLTRIVRTGTHPAAMLRRAQVLLKADADGPDGWSDMRIGKALGCSFMTVRRVRQQFVVQGLDATLHRKRPTGRQYRKLDGEQEAQLIAAVACSPAPDGRARWTMKLLAERLVELEVVGSIDPATVCRTLQKTRSSPGSSSSGSSRRRRAPRSSPTWRTCSTSTPARPPARPGAAGRLRRRGRQAVDRRDACASRCRRGRGRRRSSTATTSVAAWPTCSWPSSRCRARGTSRWSGRKTSVDFARFLRSVSATTIRPTADTVVLVCDNLSTHTPAAALYEAFEPAEARRLAKRFEWHYTPKHGSWLAERGGDRAERASAAVPRPPHPRRAATLGREVVAWERDRNAAVVKVDWQFTTTTDARVKLKRLYPTVRLQ